MGINDSVTELEDSLKGFDKLLVQSNKDALKLKASLSGMDKIVSGDNYQIISRFLSGTGAWKVLNKAKATVMTMIQLVSVQERAALQDNLRMKEMANLIKDRRELLKLESHFKKASLSQDKELIETLKEKSDVFASQAMIVGDDKALKEILRRIKKSKGILNNILGTGKVSGKTITEDPTNKNILSSNILQTAAIAYGFAINQKFLKSVAANTGVTGDMLKERVEMIDTLTAEFHALGLAAGYEQDQMTLGAFTDDKEGQDKKKDYESALLEFINKNPDIQISSLQPTVDTIVEELGIVATNMGKFSLNPKKLAKAGMDYINGIADLGAQDYKNRMDALTVRKEENKKIKNAANNYIDSLLDNRDPKTKKFISDKERYQKLADIAPREGRRNYETGRFQKGAGQFRKINPEYKALLDAAKEQQKAFEIKQSKKKDKRRDRRKAAFGQTDEQKEKYAETLMKRRKLFKRIWQKPLIEMRESIEDNGGLFGAMKEWAAEGGTKIVEFTGKILSFVKKAFIYLGLMLLALFVLYRVFKSAGVREELTKIWEYTKNFYSNYLVPPLMMVWAGLEQIIKGFKEGKFYLVILGLLKIFGGLIIFSLQLMRLGITIALKLLWESLVGIWNWLFATGQGWKKTASKIGYIASAILFLVAFFMGGWIPILIGAIILGISMLLEGMKFWAGGGTTTSGLSVVGEKGPELVKLPVGSRVHSNVDSRKMLSSGHTTNNITVQVTGRVGASDSEIKDIANKLSRELNNRMNRTGSAVSGF